MRRRKKRTQDDVFSEILQASAASDHEQRAWKVNTGDSLDKERVDRRKAQESQQEKEREVHQGITGHLFSIYVCCQTCRPTGSTIMGSPPFAVHGKLHYSTSLPK
ncbi:unnamed protein product [Caretta caretta]